MSQLVVGGSLKEFFRMLVGEAVRRQRVRLEEVTEFYVVNLLSEYAAAEKLFARTEDGSAEHELLAVLYHRALSQARDERIRTLRRLGDVSLYTAGFFHQALKDRVVGPGYYVSMGRAAYQALADLAQPSAFAAVYHELNTKFDALVEVLEEISARGQAAAGPEAQLKLLGEYHGEPDGAKGSVLAELGLLPGKAGLLN